MLNYLRYLIALILFGSLFYNYSITIPEETITKAIDKKLPLVISKKGFDINITNVTLDDVSKNNVLTSTITGTIKMNNENLIHKKATSFIGKFFKDKSDKVDAVINKKYNVSIQTKSKPQLNGHILSFKVMSLDIKKIKKIDKLQGTLQRKLEHIKIPIKKLEKLSWIASTKKIIFDIDGSLIVNVGINPWLIIFLIPLFLLREIGLLLISFYQKFLSPRKSYKCAKNHVHQNGTCSSTTKQAFKESGFIAGMKEYKKSTKECKEAYQSLENKRKVDGCDVAVCAGCDGLYAADGIEAGLSGCEIGECGSGVGDCSSGVGDCGSGVGDCGAGSCDIGAC